MKKIIHGLRYLIPLALFVAFLGCDTGGGASSEAGNGLDEPEVLWVYAGDPAFARIGTEIILTGDARNQDTLLWEQTGGTPVEDPLQDGLTYTFTIPAGTVNFEDLSFRLTAAQGETVLSSDITITAVKYTKLYRLGTFDDNTPPHKTEWKLDWTQGDASGLNEYDPGYWFTFNDSEPGGNSVISPQPVEEDSLSNEGYLDKCLKMEYQHGTNSYAYPFVGFGIKFADSADPDEKRPFDITQTTGVLFRIKSNYARGVKVSLISPKYTSWGSYDKTFTTTTDWVLKEYPWSGFVFPPSSWNPGTAFPIADILKETAGIQFQTTSQTKGESATLWVDEIYIYEL